MSEHSETILRPATALTRVLGTIHSELDSPGFNPSEIVRAMGRIIDEELWRGEAADPHAALTAPWPEGAGLTDGQIAELLAVARQRKVDRDVLVRIERVITPQIPRQGRPRKGDIIPFSGQRGTSRHNGLRRLRRDRPDLAELVEAGELTVHRAQVVAGLRKERVSVPLSSPEDAARLLVAPGRFNADELIGALRDLTDRDPSG